MGCDWRVMRWGWGQAGESSDMTSPGVEGLYPALASSCLLPSAFCLPGSEAAKLFVRFLLPKCPAIRLA